jgi:hypothetical protein
MYTDLNSGWNFQPPGTGRYQPITVGSSMSDFRYLTKESGSRPTPSQNCFSHLYKRMDLQPENMAEQD